MRTNASRSPLAPTAANSAVSATPSSTDATTTIGMTRGASGWARHSATAANATAATPASASSASRGEISDSTTRMACHVAAIPSQQSANRGSWRTTIRRWADAGAGVRSSVHWTASACGIPLPSSGSSRPYHASTQAMGANAAQQPKCLPTPLGAARRSWRARSGGRACPPGDDDGAESGPTVGRRRRPNGGAQWPAFTSAATVNQSSVMPACSP